MNTCDIPRLGRSSVSLPQRVIEALGQLQTQSTHTILGSVYVYDLVEQRTIYSSCSVAQMLKYTADEVHAMGRDGLSSLIHPDDLDVVSEHYQRFATLHFGEVITIHYRMKRADGVWCWLRSQETSLVQASDGFPLQILGMIQYITEFSLPTLEELLHGTNFLDNVN